MRSNLILLAVALSLTACAHGKYVWVDDFGDPTGDAKYTISPGDLLYVRVWNQENMSARTKVRTDGKISLPFLNDVAAAGSEPQVLAQQLQTRLKDFIVNPVVTISVEEVRPLTVSVLGEVGKPGAYPLDANTA